jgi:transaldolase
MTSLHDLTVKIFADGADRRSMLDLYTRPYISGLTTNPTLMRKAGIANYRDFAKGILSVITNKPVCFEVLSDDFADMERQALEIAGWADNVYVKIPVTNTRGESCRATVERLSYRHVKVNVTAIMTLDQVGDVLSALNPAAVSYLSIFAGRIADTGVDPMPIMAKALDMLKRHPRAEVIWASARELFNVVQADAIGCHVITLSNDILGKLPLLGHDLAAYSRETVASLYNDGRIAGFLL